MQYTKELPTKDGWYWVKRASDRGGDIMFGEYHEDGFADNPPGFYFLVDDFPVVLKRTVDWRFAGPLEEPKN